MGIGDVKQHCRTPHHKTIEKSVTLAKWIVLLLVQHPMKSMTQ